MTRTVFYSCVALVCFGVVVWLGHLFGWWLREDSVNRDAAVNGPSTQCGATAATLTTRATSHCSGDRSSHWRWGRSGVHTPCR